MELIDHYLIEIDSVYESNKTEAGIIKLNEANIQEDQEDRFLYKRLYGTVVDVPLAFTDTPISAIDDGLPGYTCFVGHDSIVDKINRGYTDWDHRQYKCSSYDGFDIITMADMAKKVNLKVGDKVYFDEKVTERENFMGYTGGSKLVGGEKPKYIFRCPVTQIYCKVEDGQIIMQGGWVLAEPDMETWEEITSPAGVIMKVEPEAKTFRAFVRHIAPRPDLEPGDHIIYVRDANVDMVVEGQTYCCMMEEEILTKIRKS
jgi:co-chaperonin GroES (HSP10)